MVNLNFIHVISSLLLITIIQFYFVFLKVQRSRKTIKGFDLVYIHAGFLLTFAGLIVDVFSSDFNVLGLYLFRCGITIMFTWAYFFHKNILRK